MIAVQPPAYFPPLDYTALLYHVDHFILADTFRYRRKTFHNRSNLRNAQGTHWIRIPLFGIPEGAPIHTVEIETGGRWQEKHWRSFLYDYRTTMYFDHYEASFRPFFENDWAELAECTCRSVELQADMFGMSTQVTRASDLEGSPASVDAVLEVIEHEGPLVVPGDAAAPSLPSTATVRFEYDHPTYHQNFEGFEPGVTAMDLLFNYGREAIRTLASGIQVETPSKRP